VTASATSASASASALPLGAGSAPLGKTGPARPHSPTGQVGAAGISSQF
jgi:hypothetical protein